MRIDPTSGTHRKLPLLTPGQDKAQSLLLPDTQAPKFDSPSVKHNASPGLLYFSSNVQFGKVRFGSTATGNPLLATVKAAQQTDRFQELNKVYSFNEFMDLAWKNPKVARNAVQRVDDMVKSKGYKVINVDGESLIQYNFFEQPVDPKNTLYGMEKPIHELMKFVGSAAAGGASKNKIALLVGPVGSAKTTIANSLKDGLREYSKTDEGALYGIQFNLKGLEKLTEKGGPLQGLKEETEAVMFEDPLKLLPSTPDKGETISARDSVFDQLDKRMRELATEKGEPQPRYKLDGSGDVSPHTRYIFDELVKFYNGDVNQVFEKHVKVKRVLIDEDKRIGIGSYEAKDEKSHRAAQLTGNIDYRNVGRFGTPSHPLAFSYDGELTKANRGIAHLDEMIKYPEEIWRVLLTAAQDRKIKPEENLPLISFDGLLLGTTNIPEWEKKIRNNQYAEAIRDRIVPITVPYNSRLRDEVRIYDKTFAPPARNKGIFVSPHLTDIAATFAMMTRLDEPANVGITLLDKVRLYNGEAIGKDFTPQKIQKLKQDAARDELLKGLSARKINEALEDALGAPDADATKTVTPFHLLIALDRKLKEPISSMLDQDRKKYLGYLKVMEDEVDRLYVLDVKRAIAGDEREMENLHARYIRNLRAWSKKEQVKNVATGRMEDIDETFMKAIEKELGISETAREGFRKDIMATAGDFALDGKEFSYTSDPNLRRAYENYLMKTNSDVTLPLGDLDNLEAVADENQRRKLQTVRDRLLSMGYNEVSAKIALSRAASPKNRKSVLGT